MPAKNKLFNEHGDREYGKRRIINGNTTNMLELNRSKYEWATKLQIKMRDDFWIPNETGLAEDKSNYQIGFSQEYKKGLTDIERSGYDLNLGWLIFLDSEQTHNIPNIADYITAPEVHACLTTHAYQELVHAQSYSYIVDTVIPMERQEYIYNIWRDNPILLDRIRYVTEGYERFHNDPSDENFIETLVLNLLLEGLYFYNGFALFYGLGRMDKMLGTVTIIRQIQRDENKHLSLFANIFRDVRRENPHLFTPKVMDMIKAHFYKAAENEIAWGEYVTQGEIAGLTPKVLDGFIKDRANRVARMIGLDWLPYPEVTRNPLTWFDEMSNMNGIKVDFFEDTEVNYTKGSNLDWNSFV